MGYRLLVIDDEELIRKGILARLEYLNIRFESIKEASTGQEALDELEKEPVDIVLTDIRMPDMDGITLIGEVKKRWPHIKFVILSGYTEFEYAERALELGVNAYLVKPLSNSAIKEVMDKLFTIIREEQNIRIAVQQQKRLVSERQEYLLEMEVNSLLGESGEQKFSKEIYPVLHEKCPQMNSVITEFLLVIINIDSQSFEKSNFRREELELLRFSIKNVFNELTCGCEKMIVNNLGKKDQLYALFWDRNPKTLRREVERIFLELKSLLEKKMELYLSFGVSGITKKVDGRSVQEAKEALEQRMLYGQSNLYFYEDMPVIHEMKFPLSEMNLLRQYLQRRGMGNIQSVIQEIFSEEKIMKYHASYIRVMWMQVLNLLVYNLGSNINRMKIIEKMLHSFSLTENMFKTKELTEQYMRLVTECLGDENIVDTNAKNKIQMAVHYIELHYNEDISVNELAERYDMSPNYFSTLFKKEVNQSTVNYITNLRISKAKECLRKSEKSIVEIAQMIGYEDCNYFFRVFKKFEGITPQQYRAGKNSKK